MALLASQGIGIFNDQHCVIDRDGGVSYLTGKRTHLATWLYLEHWADGPHATSFLNRMLRLQSYPVTDWLEELPRAGAWRPLGTELLLGMGLDLQQMTDDRQARNEASYRPSGFVASQSKNPQADADFVVEMIRLLEPGGAPGDFATLDLYLFRRIIERAFEAGRGKSAVHDHREFQIAVAGMISKLMPHSLRRTSIEQFLARDTHRDDPCVVAESENRGYHSDKNYHLQVISRASLLLRVATGAVREVLGSSNVDLDSLSFWWQNAGTAQGLWDTPPPTIDSSELWQDIGEALDDISSCVFHDDTSRRSLLTSCARPLLDATGMVRFALMGLAS